MRIILLAALATVLVLGLGARAQPDRRSVVGFVLADRVPTIENLQFILTRCSYAVECKPKSYNWPKDATVSAGSIWGDTQTVNWLWAHRGQRVRVTWEVEP